MSRVKSVEGAPSPSPCRLAGQGAAMRPRILLAEDEPILRVTLADDLAEAGYEVSAAADGAEGLQRLQERPFDAALLDLKLPKVDGLTLLDRFKAANPT